jgi:hypothetical protein
MSSSLSASPTTRACRGRWTGGQQVSEHGLHGQCDGDTADADAGEQRSDLHPRLSSASSAAMPQITSPAVNMMTAIELVRKGRAARVRRALIA